ncbi:MATE family multidrug resistance protein [Scopulibacillus darangshiensis]|uniref:Probable multidrug resistance protein NorM n=1 Tax=Scopulibacillus darangshiensis TaxID=442528 RepID=A0A4R2P931_9BACL|nr:MATE family efflux transporter [Scopulibacillus darangshiensis]TCP31519.1 MATE family multidrug resistance protein [Scopulibacillus darangshiensis]
MYQTHSMKQKFRLLVSILFPILVTQLGMYAMTFFDTVMSGHAGADDLAGVAIGSSIWVPVFTGLSGILLGLTPIISHLIGADNRKDVPFSFLQAIYLAIAISIAVIIIGILVVDPILNGMDLNPQVQRIAANYLKALGFGVIPLFIYTVLRCFIDAHGFTRLTMFITLTSLPVNVIFNYFFIFGKWGFPKLGGVGAGVATAITYWVIAFIALFVVIRINPFTSYGLFKRFYHISFGAWKEQLKIGVPIGFAIFFETSIFAAVTLLMSRFDTFIIASHQAAMNFASFLYMIPLSISMALTIAVGFEAGANRFKDSIQYSYLGIGIALGMAVIFALGLLALNDQVAMLYTTSDKVAKMIKHFLLYAIFFQLSDAIAAPIQGALRGYKDVNVTFIMALISYWVIGLPLGYILANYSSMGPFGYWIGLIAGLAVGAVCLYGRLSIVQKRKKAVALKGE